MNRYNRYIDVLFTEAPIVLLSFYGLGCLFLGVLKLLGFHVTVAF